MQPIVFSHGLTANRMLYSAMCMELASYGYCVITLTHNDGSADYSKEAGEYDGAENYDYWGKNFGVKIREKEVNAVVAEITKPWILASFGPDWKPAQFTDNLVLMGHSYGGITALGAAEQCQKAKAIVALDPWFFPHYQDEIKAADSQQTLVVMTEDFPKLCAKESNGVFDTFKEMNAFTERSKQGLTFKGLKDMHHFNQHDLVLVDPTSTYMFERGSLPHRHYLDYYMLNVWLAMQFLEEKGLCSYP